MSVPLFIIIFALCLAISFYEGLCQGKAAEAKKQKRINLDETLKKLEAAKEEHISQIIDEGANVYKEQVFWSFLFHEYLTNQILNMPEWSGKQKEAAKIAHKIINEESKQYREKFEPVYKQMMAENVRKKMEEKNGTKNR